MRKALLLVRPLLWQNRWLLLLLLLWPYGMAAILLVPEHHPAADDVLAILKQECFYGVALVAFNGAALLGNEQRSRRIVTVLSRGIGRPHYLFALLLAAWLPLALYLVGFTIAGCALVFATGAGIQLVWQAAVAQLAVGLWMACVSILFSIYLPSIMASLASLAVASSLAYFAVVGPGRILAELMKMTLEGMQGARVLDEIVSLVFAAGVFLLACALFARRDLDLKSD
jgi:hypothetical protein